MSNHPIGTSPGSTTILCDFPDVRDSVESSGRFMRNALSIDFEDWYQPFTARGISGWEGHPSRVPRDTERLLSVLAKYNVRCTFFILGEVAEKFPDEIRAIHRAGHEI